MSGKTVDEVKLVRIVSTGTGSKRVTIPRDMFKEVFGNLRYAAIRREKSGLLLIPIDVRAGKEKIDA